MTSTTRTRRRWAAPNTILRGSLISLLAAGACADIDDDGEGSGSLTVLVDAEEVIRDGLAPGPDGAEIRDGWSVSFDKYLVTVGNVHLNLATDHDVEVSAKELYVVDLKRVPSQGLDLWQLDDLQPGRWEFSYETGGAAHDAERHDTVSQDDFELMVDNDWTYLVEGVLTHPSGRSCPPVELASPAQDAEPSGENGRGEPCYEVEEVRFVVGARAETVFSACTHNGVSGVSVAADGSQSAAVTIHGDHLFFNGFPEGHEGGIARYAQWWADADLDLNGMVDTDELAALAPADLAEFDGRYSTGGSPIQPLDTMLDYVIAQFKTQGHYQGEGECLADGMAHDHAHDEDEDLEHGEDEDHEHAEDEHGDAGHDADDHDHDEEELAEDHEHAAADAGHGEHAHEHADGGAAHDEDHTNDGDAGHAEDEHEHAEDDHADGGAH